LGSFKGLPGFFVAGIFSGALSTVSSGLNSLAAITLKDFVSGWRPEMEDGTDTQVSKGLSVAFGFSSFGFVLIAQRLGGILQAGLSILGITGGPLLGVFTLGMFFPWANGNGALGGIILAQVFMLWLGFGTQAAKRNGHLLSPPLPFRTDGCTSNLTLPEFRNGTDGGIYEFYKISYIWYSFIGCMITILVGLFLSKLTSKSWKENAKNVNPDLLSPIISKSFQVGSSFSPRDTQGSAMKLI